MSMIDALAGEDVTACQRELAYQVGRHAMLRERLVEMEKALRFYAERENWVKHERLGSLTSVIDWDYGRRARDALKGV
jgi:hypothetical protein